MQTFPISPTEMVASFLRNRGLIMALIKREVVGRYRGSILGIFWSLFNPILMLAVYTFVFSIVFKARWSSGSDSKAEFALILFAGLIMFNLFAECINRAPSLILANTNYVKKVIFPLEILPWVALGSALFHSMISICVWLAAYVCLYGFPHITVLFLPFIILPLVLMIVGLSWVLASMGVYLRDVSQFVGIITMMLMFLSPIFYPITALPKPYRSLLFMNPLMPVIEEARNVMFWGKLPQLTMMGTYMAIAVVTAWLGFAWFQKTRKGFADVL